MRNTTLNKTVSLLLCFLVLFSFTATGVFAVENNRENSKIPTIWVHGQGAFIYDKDGNCVYNVPEPDGYIAEAVKDCLPSLIDAVLLSGLSEKYNNIYKEKLLSYLAPLYDGFRLDNNGEANDGTHIAFDYTDKVSDNKNADGTYNLNAYGFISDWRLSPLVKAEQLRIYIQSVLEATGSATVNLYGRCEGCTVVAAYLQKYGDDLVNKVALNISTSNGIETVSKMFSGKIVLDASTADDYATHSFVVGDEIFNDFFWAMWDALKRTGGLNMTAAGINLIYKTVIIKCIPDCVLASYGTMPGIWAMMDEEDYQDALDFVFDSEEKRTEYAGLIEKITDYHDNVQSKQNDMLLDLKDKGHEIGIFAKYGFPTLALCADSQVISDGDVRLCLSSFGATTADWGETFTDKYITQQTKAGKAKYISPDLMVDTSTCLFPDTTWIIKGVYHNIFPVELDNLVNLFFQSTGMTVNTCEQYPQFLVYETDDSYSSLGHVVPMTENNANTEDNSLQAGTQTSGTLNLFERLRRLIEAIRAFFEAVREKTLNLNFGLNHF